MLKVALKGLLARKLRTALTGFAVVIGVAFVAGTFVFTDTIDASFKDLFERASKGTDVSVQSQVVVEEDFATPPPMDASTLERIQSVDGVEEAAGFVSGDVSLLDRDGEPIVSGGPPTLLLTTGPERFDPFDYTEGGPPQSADEVVIDKATADEFDWGEGDTVTIAGRQPKKDYTVSGVARLGDSDNLAGSRMTLVTLDEGQRVLNMEDELSDISVAAASGTSPEELKAAIAAELGRGYAVRTGEEQAEKSAQDLSDALGFIRTALLVFAAVAVLVGGFLIFNTFAVTVAQRSREFALFRTLGASRAPDPELGDGRVGGDRPRGVDRRHRGRPRRRPRPARPARRLRARPREHEQPAAAADDRHRAPGRRDRHRRLRLRAGPSRHSRPARRGDARGRAACARAPAPAPHHRRPGRRGRRRGPAALRPARRSRARPAPRRPCSASARC